VGGPSARLDGARVGSLAPLVRAAADRISLRLGAPPDSLGTIDPAPSARASRRRTRAS
jgi:hypothetical protein